MRKGKVAECSADNHGLKLLENPGPKQEAALGQPMDRSKDIKWQQKDAGKASHKITQILDHLRPVVALMDLSM